MKEIILQKFNFRCRENIYGLVDSDFTNDEFLGHYPIHIPKHSNMFHCIHLARIQLGCVRCKPLPRPTIFGQLPLRIYG